MVEFALVLPIFMLMTFGIIEFSLLLYNKAMLTNAAREGARYGIVLSPTGRMAAADIQDVVINYGRNHMITFAAPRPEIKPPTLEIYILNGGIETKESDYGPTNFDYGEYLRVTAEYDYTFLVLPNIFKLINAVSGTDLPTIWALTAVSQMRSE
jgi:hypothetical protein